MPLIKQPEVYPAADIPWADAQEAYATAAIAQNDVVILDGATGSLPDCSPASSATPETSTGLLYVAAGAAAAAGDKLNLLPWKVLTEVDTSGATAGDPVYLSTGGDWSLTPGTEQRVVGFVLAVSATVGKVMLAPGAYTSKVTISSEVIAHEFFDDFLALATDWTVTEDSAGATQAVGDARFGVVTLTNAATTDDDACQIQYAQETFELVSGKRLIFEARIRCAAGDATNLDFFVGLAAAEDLTGVADNMPANGIGFHKDDGDTNIDASSSDGGTNLQSAAVGTLVDNTWTVLKLVFDGGATGSATITPYVDGTAGTAISSVTYATMAEIAPIFMVRNGDATTQQTLEVDYVRIIQER